MQKIFVKHNRNVYDSLIWTVKLKTSWNTFHQVHDPPTDPHEVLRAAGWLSDRQLDLLSPSIYQKHPNSYTYSKRMAEALVREYYPSLPAAVIRPSIGKLLAICHHQIKSVYLRHATKW